MKLLKEEREFLGTLVSIELPSSFSFLVSTCFEEIQRIEKTYSRFLDSSELSQLNTNLNSWQSISKEFFTLITQGLLYQKNTKGSFDITLKSILDDLGYDKEYSFKKKTSSYSPSLLQKLRSSLQKNVLLDNNKQEVFLRKEIDLGGFGKGFAVDRVKDILQKNNVPYFVIDAGGDMYIQSEKNKPLQILLEHPLDTEKAIGFIHMSHGAIASSSPSRRSWKDGHHLIDAKTKKPAHSIKHVFVLADSCVDADAYATALFTAGFAQAIALSRTLLLEVYILSSDGELYLSPGFKAEFFE